MSVVTRQTERSREHTSTQGGMRSPGAGLGCTSADRLLRSRSGSCPPAPCADFLPPARPETSLARSSAAGQKVAAVAWRQRPARWPGDSGAATDVQDRPNRSEGKSWLTSSRWDAASRTGATVARCRSRSSPTGSGRMSAPRLAPAGRLPSMARSSPPRANRRRAPSARAATATHHQCPPNQPGWESLYHFPPNVITPMNTRPATAPNTPRATA